MSGSQIRTVIAECVLKNISNSLFENAKKIVELLRLSQSESFIREIVTAEIPESFQERILEVTKNLNISNSRFRDFPCDEFCFPQYLINIKKTKILYHLYFSSLLEILGSKEWVSSVKSIDDIPTGIKLACVAAEGPMINYLYHTVCRSLPLTGIQKASFYPGSSLFSFVPKVIPFRQYDVSMEAVCIVYTYMLKKMSLLAISLQKKTTCIASHRVTTFQILSSLLIPFIGEYYHRYSPFLKTMSKDCRESKWWNTLIRLNKRLVPYLKEMKISTGYTKPPPVEFREPIRNAIDMAINAMRPTNGIAHTSCRTIEADVITCQDFTDNYLATYFLAADYIRFERFLSILPPAQRENVFVLSMNASVYDIIHTVSTVSNLEPDLFKPMRIFVSINPNGGSFLAAEMKWLEALRCVAFPASSFKGRQSKATMPMYPILLKMYLTEPIGVSKNPFHDLFSSSTMDFVSQLQMKSALAWILARLAPGVRSSYMFSYLFDVHSIHMNSYALLPILLKLYTIEEMKNHIAVHILHPIFISPLCRALSAFITCKPFFLPRHICYMLQKNVPFTHEYYGLFMQSVHRKVASYDLFSKPDLEFDPEIGRMLFYLCCDNEFPPCFRRIILESISPDPSFFSKNEVFRKEDSYDVLLQSVTSEYTKNYILKMETMATSETSPYFISLGYRMRKQFFETISGVLEHVEDFFSSIEHVSMLKGCDQKKVDALVEKVKWSSDRNECIWNNLEIPPCTLDPIFSDTSTSCLFDTPSAFGLIHNGAVATVNINRFDSLVVHPDMIPFAKSFTIITTPALPYETELASIALCYYEMYKLMCHNEKFPFIGESKLGEMVIKIISDDCKHYDTCVISEQVYYILLYFFKKI